jgi:hypothetical protein
MSFRGRFRQDGSLAFQLQRLAGSRKFAEESAYRLLGAAAADHTESF